MPISVNKIKKNFNKLSNFTMYTIDVMKIKKMLDNNGSSENVKIKSLSLIHISSFSSKFIKITINLFSLTCLQKTSHKIFRNNKSHRSKFSRNV